MAIYFKDSYAANLISKKIKPQFPESPEGKLMYAIVDQALSDAFKVPAKPTTQNRLDRRSAIDYLQRKSIAHCEICGVDSEWVRSVISKIRGEDFSLYK